MRQRDSARHAVTPNSFVNSGVDSGPLHALQSGVDGVNGLYLYGSGGFPSAGTSSNYWVEPVFVPRKPAKPAEPAAPKPREPRRFKVVDLMSRRILAEDVDARRAVAALSGGRSVVDVNIFVWDEEGERWRMLSFAQRRTLWEHRDQAEG